MMASQDIGKSGISDLELDLESLLKPVQPRPEFVSELYQNILMYPNWKITVPSFLKLLLLILAAIVSGLLIMVTGARAIFMILATVKIFRNEKSSASKNGVTVIETTMVTN